MRVLLVAFGLFAALCLSTNHPNPIPNTPPGGGPKPPSCPFLQCGK